MKIEPHVSSAQFKIVGRNYWGRFPADAAAVSGACVEIPRSCGLRVHIYVALLALIVRLALKQLRPV